MSGCEACAHDLHDATECALAESFDNATERAAGYKIERDALLEGTGLRATTRDADLAAARERVSECVRDIVLVVAERGTESHRALKDAWAEYETCLNVLIGTCVAYAIIDRAGEQGE